MIWLLAYVAAMFLIALPVAVLSRNIVAAVVFLVWCVGQISYAIGIPEALGQTVIYSVSFAGLWFRIAPRANHMRIADLGAVVLFLPLALVAFLWWRGDISRDDAWWPIWRVAMIQACLLIRPIKWTRAAIASVRRRAVDTDTNFLMTAARMGAEACRQQTA